MGEVAQWVRESGSVGGSVGVWLSGWLSEGAWLSG